MITHFIVREFFLPSPLERGRGGGLAASFLQIFYPHFFSFLFDSLCFFSSFFSFGRAGRGGRVRRRSWAYFGWFLVWSVWQCVGEGMGEGRG